MGILDEAHRRNRSADLGKYLSIIYYGSVGEQRHLQVVLSGRLGL